MSQLDFFGRRHWRPSPRKRGTQLDAFEQTPWLDAARAWAAAGGLVIEGHTISQSVKAGGEWYAVVWCDERGTWEVEPVG